MSNSELYQKLVSIYGVSKNQYSSGVVLHDNGVIEVRRSVSGQANRSADRVFIPNNCNTSNMISYIENGSVAGGKVNDFIDSTDGNFDYIVSASNNYADKGNSMSFAEEVANTIGLKIKNVTVAAHSAAAGYSFSSTERFLENTDSKNVNIVVSDVAAIENMYSSNGRLSNIDTLQASNATVTIISNPGWGGPAKTLAENLYKNGITTFIIESDDNTVMSGNGNTHQQHNVSMINNQIPQYVLGVNSSLSNYSLDNCNYRVYKYDPSDPNANSNGYVAATLNDIVGANLLTFDSYTNSSSFNVEFKNIDASSFFSELGNIQDIPIDAENTSSNYSYTVSSMNNIRSQISASAKSCSSASVVSGRFSSGILASIGSYVNKFYNAYGNLLSSLKSETDAVVSLADAIDDMDRDLANNQNNIGSIIENENSVENASNYKNNDEDQSKSKDSSVSGVSRPSGGGSSSKNDDSNILEKEIINGNTISYKINDESNYLIEYNGDSITSMQCNYTFSTNEEANQKYESIYNNIEKYENISDVSVEDNIVKIKYSESFISNYNINTIEEYLKGLSNEKESN